MNHAPAATLFEEITDFLSSAPSTSALIDYQPSERLNERLHELLDRNKDGTLTADEQLELTDFLRMNHFLRMLKLKARLRLQEQE